MTRNAPRPCWTHCWGRTSFLLASWKIFKLSWQSGGVTYTGRALYPRYLPVNVGDPGLSEKDTFSPRPYARIVFYLVGPQNWALELPAAE